MPRRRAAQPQGGVVFLLVTVLLMIVGLFNSLAGAEVGEGTVVTDTPFNPSPVIPTPSPYLPPVNWWEVHFTDPLKVNDPSNILNSVEQKLIDRINLAQFSIHIASFEFDLTAVAEALIAAYNRGVDVRWVTDDENGLLADEEPGRGQFALLQAAGIEVRADTRSALMHNKFWIFDGQTIWTGSTNITKNGVYKQDNNVLVIHSGQLAGIFEKEFQEMWDGQFGPRSPSQLGEQFFTLNGSPILVIFTPEDGALERGIIPVVQSAQRNIRFLAFSYTDYPLADAMIQRARAGVDVAGVFETVGSNTEAAELRTLYCAGVPVRRDGNPSFLHDKVIIIDERIVITGSLNFSTNAETSNDENVIIIDNAEIAALYIQDFGRIWGIARDPEPAQITCQ